VRSGPERLNLQSLERDGQIRQHVQFTGREVEIGGEILVH
jgi:hypothetical protein